MVWCTENNLALNIKKTNEIIIDFRKKQDVHTTLHFNREMVERVSSFKFLGTHLMYDKHHGTSQEGTKAAVLLNNAKEGKPVWWKF